MRRTVILISLAVFAVFGVHAQEPPEAPTAAMRVMLAITPDTQEARAYWQFTDFAAARAAAPELAYESIDALTADQDSDRVRAAILALPFSELISDLDFDALGDFIASNGFDLFALDQAAEVGNPPAHGFILRGSFDRDRVNAALTRRGWAAADQFGFSGWCNSDPDGCNAGTRSDPRRASQQRADFFDNIGRRPPVLLIEDSSSLVFAYANPVLETLAEAQSGGETLMQALEYDAITTAVDTYSKLGAFVRMAFTIDPEDLSDPLLQAAMLVDTVDSTAQVASIVLAYPDQESAQLAGENVIERLHTLSSHRMQAPFEEMIADRGGTIGDPVVVQGELGGWAVLIPIQYPLAILDPDADEQVQPYRVYEMLLQTVFNQDLAYLAAD